MPMRLRKFKQLREPGYRVDYPLTPAKRSASSFKPPNNSAHASRFFYGDEWPQVKVKNLRRGEER